MTGFTPFDGREVNGSWIAARALRDQIGGDAVRVLEIPVVWGAPLELLTQTLKDFPANVILSFGEGEPGGFKLETLAMNRRVWKADIAGKFPPQDEIIPGGPACVSGHALLRRVRKAVFALGVPVVLSLDAGGYLCEETLFLLEHLAKGQLGVRHAFFIHVPPYGTPLQFRGQERLCDAGLLAEFTGHLYPILAREAGLGQVPA